MSAGAERSRGRAGLARQLVRRLRSAPMVAVGVVIILAVALAAVFAPLLSHFDPNTISFGEKLRAPGAGHWLGTDELGRDIWTRVVFGARISLSIAIVVVALAMTAGLLIGALAGFAGGWLDTVIMRTVDVLIAIPGLVLAMALTAALGPSLEHAMIALAFVALPSYIRLVRGQALVARHAGYTEAAESFGAGGAYIIRVHIIPDCLPVALVQGSLDVGRMILAAAALSFLGLGAQPPSPEWGAMVATGRQYLMTHWWYPTAPGIAILITAVGFNLVGDGVRDWLDPTAETRR